MDVLSLLNLSELSIKRSVRDNMIFCKATQWDFMFRAIMNDKIFTHSNPKTRVIFQKPYIVIEK